jgi:hypothetical protein
MASEDISRTVLREPVEQATRNLIVRIATESPDPRAIKRTLYRSVHALSSELADSAASAVATARMHARDLATGQAESDLAGFVLKAQAAGFEASVPMLNLRIVTSELDAAIANQAGLAIAHRWSSQVLGTYVSWKRNGDGVDGFARALGGVVGTPALESGTGVGALVETQAITQSVDAYADQHALLWREAAGQIPGTTLYEAGGGGAAGSAVLSWGGGLFDIWSAMMDRNTCARCAALDGESVPVGQDWPGVGRMPLHPRCLCQPVSVWVYDAAVAQLSSGDMDLNDLRSDLKTHMQETALSADREAATDHVQRAMSGFGPLRL